MEKINEIIPGVYKFNRYKQAIEFMERQGLNEWKIFEGDGFLLYKNHNQLRVALNKIGRNKSLGKALKIQIATKVSDFLDKGLLAVKKVVKKNKKDIENHKFGNEGTLFTPSKENKLSYFKVGSFYEVEIYTIVKQYNNKKYVRRSYKKQNNELLTMRKPQFIDFLVKNKYIK